MRYDDFDKPHHNDCDCCNPCFPPNSCCCIGPTGPKGNPGIPGATGATGATGAKINPQLVKSA